MWGIGRKLAPKLCALNIATAYDLSRYPLRALNKFNINVECIAYELQGLSCFLLEKKMPSKSIQSSRSFGKSVTAVHELQEAISYYAALACEKLRKQKSLAQGVCVCIQTSRFKDKEQRYFNQKIIELIQPTDDTRIIISQAVSAVGELYKSGYEYSKCSIVLMNIISNSIYQYQLLSQELPKSNSHLMKVVDSINHKYGKNTLQFAMEGLKKEWMMKSELRSPRYTTRWRALKTRSFLINIAKVLDLNTAFFAMV